ncbi:MAG TPA: hypothetical protein VGN56_00385 [Candidatus Paceibacterota bacterium]|jgi:hypothetical protein|nr:hypothetical protein [Candidatus Paceibacterota bacterium]
MADDTATSFSRTPDDPTPYIRTYAKDVARLTGTQAAQHAGPAKEAPTPGVAFGEIDVSQTQGVRGEGASPREFPQETLSVTKEDTIANLNAPAPSREDKRDEILSRLRAKVQPAAPAMTAVPAPAIPAPFTPAPTTPATAAPAPRPEFPLFGRHEPKPSAANPPESDLHTFKSDFADRIDEQKASTFSVLAAQSDVRETRANAPQPVKLPSKNKSRIPMILTACVLVVLGIGALGGAYWFLVLRSPAAAVPFTVPSLIFADEKVELSRDAAPIQALAQAAQQPAVPGNVVVTYVTTTANGKNGIIKSPQPGGALIKQILGSAPDILLRNIDDSSTVGIIDAGDANAPFFILRVSSYERTFAGMLGWEPTIASDLSALYPVSAGATQADGVRGFIDATVANHDVRILKDSANNTILLYGYRDKQTLIIAKDEAAFTALLVRLDAANGS